MTMPFFPPTTIDRAPSDGEVATYIAGRDDATLFHSLPWCRAVTRGTGHPFYPLVARDAAGGIIGYLPLHHIRAWLFGDALVSTGFAVEGGILADDDRAVAALADAAIQLAGDLKVASIELRGGPVPEGWASDATTNVNFSRPLAGTRDAEMSAMPKRHRAEVRKSLATDFQVISKDSQLARDLQLAAIPRKHRAEVRKGLRLPFEARTGRGSALRGVHYRLYAESVRNLGTPVFPRTLFDAVLDGLGDDAETMTLSLDGQPVSSVLNLYWRGTAMPYWGGGTTEARKLRANERLYFELMDHARGRGATHFDFGRSKTGSGPAAWKHNWGFEARPLTYARWTTPGTAARNTSAQSPRYAQMVALWKKLPLWLANRLGPLIARQLG